MGMNSFHSHFRELRVGVGGSRVRQRSSYFRETRFAIEAQAWVSEDFEVPIIRPIANSFHIFWYRSPVEIKISKTRTSGFAGSTWLHFLFQLIHFGFELLKRPLNRATYSLQTSSKRLYLLILTSNRILLSNVG